MPGSVVSGTHCILDNAEMFVCCT